ATQRSSAQRKSDDDRRGASAQNSEVLVPEAQAPATFTVAGFKIAATAAGIKKNGLDLGLLYSDHPATTAAVFTKNAFPAAPILVTREHLKASGNTTRAVLVNAGNATAVT